MSGSGGVFCCCRVSTKKSRSFTFTWATDVILLHASCPASSPNVPEEEQHAPDAQEEGVHHLEGAYDRLEQKLNLDRRQTSPGGKISTEGFGAFRYTASTNLSVDGL